MDGETSVYIVRFIHLCTLMLLYFFSFGFLVFYFFLNGSDDSDGSIYQFSVFMSRPRKEKDKVAEMRE